MFPLLLTAQQNACGTVMRNKNRHKYKPELPFAADQTYTVPVIFHVLHHTESENVPDSLIKGILETLLEDFSGINADLSDVPAEFKDVIGNPNINFVLATQLPDSTPTIGIIRQHTNTVQFRLNERKVFNESPIIKSESYLNIYVCNVNTNAFTPSENNPKHDGIVIKYTRVKKGSRTLTHETGHWLNLYHIFEGECNDRDGVKDTHAQKKHSMDDCFEHPKKECGTHAMFMNYMDYGLCRYFFTAGQVQRMRQYIIENKKFQQ
jgi:hypothetical protein